MTTFSEAGLLLPQEAARCADDNRRWHGIGSTWVAPPLCYNADLLDQDQAAWIQGRRNLGLGYVIFNAKG
jgi:hypothetical protein